MRLELSWDSKILPGAALWIGLCVLFTTSGTSEVYMFIYRD